MAAAIVYGVSIILEYLASTLYHAIQPARAKRVFRIIDHSCIYLLIAGSYTPFCLITLANDGGAVLFFAVWAIAIIGIALECFMRERQPHWVSGLVYLLMGWLVVFKLPELVALLNPVALALLAVGGVCYTAGVPFYIAKNVFGRRCNCRIRRQRFNPTSRILEVRETPDGHNHLPYHHPRFDPHQRLLLYV